jgi:hypothetical protein
VQSSLNGGSTFTVYLPMTRRIGRTTGERSALVADRGADRGAA